MEVALFTVTLTLPDMPEKNAGSSVRTPEIKWAESPIIVRSPFTVSEENLAHQRTFSKNNLGG